MAFQTTKKKIRNLADEVSLDFYQPKRVLFKYGYTQSLLSQKLGVSPASVNSIVNGNPSIAQVKIMADAIGCPFSEFFDFSDTAGSEVSEKSCNHVKCPACGASLGISAL